jgi:hypothetical protein
MFLRDAKAVNSVTSSERTKRWVLGWEAIEAAS